jgi:hypothetical protein
MKAFALMILMSSSPWTFAEEKTGYFDYFIAPASSYVDWSSPSTTLNTFISSLMKTGPLNFNKVLFQKHEQSNRFMLKFIVNNLHQFSVDKKICPFLACKEINILF